MLSSRAAYSLLAVFAALNIYLNLLQLRVMRRVARTRPPPPDKYTFVDDDYTPRLPVPNASRSVKFIFEDSVRYGLWEDPITEEEWRWTATAGDGNVHLGPNSRFFVVGITHQLHCMRSYRQALAQEQPLSAHQVSHLTHCLNFLRMSTLCAADITLEPPDAFMRNHTQERAGGEHECLDWPAFYEEMKKNFLDWNVHQHGLTKEVHTH
ncbi:hypothetical protein GY45DRAFT_1324915 [Cubamyces sp. BRFM 1775]|nr:hypothetical protein GY45DRAFT_1324915 [Cubamyces sp. BRFM 1775]